MTRQSFPVSKRHAAWKPWRPGAVVAAAALLGAAAWWGLFQARSQWQPARTPWPAAESARLDINRAGAAEWASLPGIGPALAGRIVALRARRRGFRSPEDLLDVKGLGPAKLERLRPWLADPAGGDR
ncbi:MAG: helix-hairpin-helix domain-containing protein [candidate division FCPU426 bacterium]